MDTYIITSQFSRLQGVGLRYRLRKVAQENNIELHAQNLAENRVQFSVPNQADLSPIRLFLKEFRPDATITKKE